MEAEKKSSMTIDQSIELLKALASKCYTLEDLKSAYLEFKAFVLDQQSSK